MMKKPFSVLKKVTIASLIITAVAMLLELVFVRALKVEYESIAFLPVRFATLIAANMLGGCILTKVLKEFIVIDLGGDSLGAYNKVKRPILYISAFLIIVDCVKDSLLHPSTTTVSAVLIMTYTLLAALASIFIIKYDPEANKALLFPAMILEFLVCAAALAVFVICVCGDISVLFS